MTGYTCTTCGQHIEARTSAMQPFDWDEEFRIEWRSGPEDDRTRVMANEYGEQRFPNVGKWRFCSLRCLIDHVGQFDGREEFLEVADVRGSGGDGPDG